MTECSIDLRVGGNYHSCFVTGDGTVFSFSGDIPGGRAAGPNRGDVALPTVGRMLRQSKRWSCKKRDGVTTFTWRLAFRDKAGRDHMTSFDGRQDSLDEMEDYLRSLLDQKAIASR